MTSRSSMSETMRISLWQRGQRSGSASHSYDGITIAQRSDDHGASWSEPVVVFDGRELDPPESMIQPVLVAPRDGSLLCLSPVVLGTSTDRHPLLSAEGFAHERRYYKQHSRDGGRTWTEPERLDHLDVPQLGLSGKSFVLPNGELFINAAHPSPAGSRCAAACYSSDHGCTIGPLMELFRDPANRWNYDEANYTVFPDGTILGLYWTWRSRDGDTMEILETAPVHRSTSRDNGRTWSLPKATNLVGQVSSPYALDDQTVLVASNYRFQPAGIRLWLSRDRGETFDGENVIQMWDPEREEVTCEPLEAPPVSVDQGPQTTWGHSGLDCLSFIALPTGRCC